MSERADRFLVWRAGVSVNWRCTQQEIADEAGLSRKAVSRICRKFGYKTQGGNGDDGYTPSRSRRSVDSRMRQIMDA